MIHAKGFDMIGTNYAYEEEVPLEYKKIKVGVKNLENAVLNIATTEKLLPNHKFTKKEVILKALATNDLRTLRDISNFYYNISGIYQTACHYLAFLYRYDWYVAPEVYEESVKESKVLKEFANTLNYLDNSYIRKICGDIALTVIREGSYYGYVVPTADRIILQQLPSQYCRSRYSVNGMPAIEFNMSYFDTFHDPVYRMKILGLFPEEFAKGYLLYRQHKLPSDNGTDTFGCWYLLDPESAIKFNINGSDMPILVNAVPALIDLDAAQDLDRRKQMQKLLKILVQKLPTDKNGDLIFDIDEAQDVHNNAVAMLDNAIGVDILTTFADIDAIDISDRNTATTVDDLEKVERTVYNALGMSQNIFNTEGNTALEKSILNDESSIRNLLLQFNMFFDRIITKRNTNSKKYHFKFYMLETTQYNYKEMAKLYKEQTQIGYSKMLPQIALGHSQSFILNTAHFENEVLHLSEIMIPPLMSSTLNGDDILGNSKKTTTAKTQGTTTETKTGGRPEKPDDQKSDKTLANREAMS